jgi:hypothetical protein
LLSSSGFAPTNFPNIVFAVEAFFSTNSVKC